MKSSSTKCIYTSTVTARLHAVNPTCIHRSEGMKAQELYPITLTISLFSDERRLCVVFKAALLGLNQPSNTVNLQKTSWSSLQ